MSDMAAISPQQLNKLFVLLHRSLLQYVGECWPWTSELGRDNETLATAKQLVGRQKKNESSLSEALNDVGWPIDFGGYPTAFTDLQYLSLSYLLKQVGVSQTAIVAAFDAAARSYPDSPLLQQIADSEREILKTVQSLVATKAVTARAS
jgi:hypothetical protein